tara:strand:- start:6469 stop:6927 length:459 start_codon:yes stop_codon:yes gene_type:complete
MFARRILLPTIANRNLLTKATFSTKKKYLPETHEWIEITDDNNARMGITNHAQNKLGEISFVELPGIGHEFEEGNEVVAIESTKAVGEVQMPIDGIITSINEEVSNDATLINKDPENKGWLFCFKFDSSQINSLQKKLVDLKEYKIQIENED